MILGGMLILVFGLTSIYFGYDYFPLVLFVLLAFSVEIQLTGDTRITLPTEILIPFLVLLFIGEFLLRGRITYRPSVMNLGVALFFLVILGSALITHEPVSTFKALIRDAGYIFAGYYIIPRFINSPYRLKILLIGGLSFHTLLVLYGFGTQAVNGIRIYDKIAAPFFIEHCIYAAYITLSFSFLLAFFLDRKPDGIRLLLGGITFLFAVAFVRAAWLSIILLLIFYLFQFSKQRSSVDLIILMMIGFMIALAVVFTSDVGRLLTQRVGTITDLNYTANYDRIDRWMAAWEMWKDNLIYGVGWGAYPDVYYDYATLESYSSEFRMGAHNLYLELLAELGIIGLFFYLLMIYIFFRQAIILQPQVKDRTVKIFLIGMQGAMLTYLFHVILNNLGPSDKISLFFWFMLGMIPTIQGIVKAQNAEKKILSAPSQSA